MERLLELARECHKGTISLRDFRSRLVACLSMLEDGDTLSLVEQLLKVQDY